MFRIVQVRVVGPYRLHLTFTNGQSGEVDLTTHILHRGGVFAPLEDPTYFARVTVDPEAGIVTWPNCVDFCPDVLYSLATGQPVPAGSAA